MGEDADRLEFVGRPQLHVLEALSSITDVGIDDPALLARFIDGHAGHDLDANAIGLEAEVRAMRRHLMPLLVSLQQSARETLAIPRQVRKVSSLEHALADLLDSNDELHTRTQAAKRYLDALETIRSTSFRSSRADFSGKPESDWPITRIVTAVADYCWHMGIRFTGAPRRGQADNKAVHLPKTYAAKLTIAVLTALGAKWNPAEVATHMNKARKTIRELRGPAAKLQK